MAAEPLARTRAGDLIGDVSPAGTLAFRGIPYAEPPVGPRRFRPPEPARPWRSARDARRFGPGASQHVLGHEVFDVAEMSEDCLHLNVFTPACDAGRRPVLLWIHGGGLMKGSAVEPVHDGGRLAAEGIVVVTINYRTGVLGGFLRLWDLGAPLDASGNLGLLDQRLALRWVADHIDAFGGDPARIVVAGDSAGATSAALLVADPASRPLISGAWLTSPQPVTALAGDDALALTDAYLEALGRPTATQLAGLPADTLVAAQDATRGVVGRRRLLLPHQPQLDPATLPVPPIDQLAGSTVPFVIGTMRDELAKPMAPMVPDGAEAQDAWVAKRCAGLFDDPARAAEVAAAYQSDVLAELDPPPPPGPVLLDSDRVIRMSAIALCERLDAVRAFMLTWPEARGYGVTHMLAVPLLFGTTEAGPWAEITGGDERARRASERYRSLVVGAVRGETAAWPAYGTSRTTALLDLEHEPRVVDDPWSRQRRCLAGEAQEVEVAAAAAATCAPARRPEKTASASDSPET